MYIVWTVKESVVWSPDCPEYQYQSSRRRAQKVTTSQEEVCSHTRPLLPTPSGVAS